jgi:hypothetical protein
MCLIFYTYTRVVKVLWRIDKSIAWDDSNSNSHLKPIKNMVTTSPPNSSCGLNSTASTYTFSKINNNNNNSSTNINYTMASGSTAAKTKMKNQLIARRKAAKMLISVAVMFAICYLPIHLLNVLRFAAPDLMESLLGNFIQLVFQIAHTLVYVNSSINPLIYYFMSGKYF